MILGGNLTKEPYAAKASSTYSGYEKSRPAGRKAGPPSYIALTCFLIMQALKITDISPKHNFSFQKVTQKSANYTNLTIATKQQKITSIIMYTTFTSLPRLGDITQVAGYKNKYTYEA